MKNQRQNIFALKYGELRGQKEDGSFVEFVSDDNLADFDIVTEDNVGDLVAAYIAGLPTSDPSEAGALWLNSNVVTVSAG